MLGKLRLRAAIQYCKVFRQNHQCRPCVSSLGNEPAGSVNIGVDIGTADHLHRCYPSVFRRH